MFELSQLIIAYQVLLVSMLFILGVVAAVLVTIYSTDSRWKIVDLVWVIFGGIAAVSALIASIYISDDTRIARRVDLIYSMFDRIGLDTEQFIFEHCDDSNILPFFRGNIQDVCNPIVSLRSTLVLINRQPLFTEVSEISSLQTKEDEVLALSFANNLGKGPFVEFDLETNKKLEFLLGSGSMMSNGEAGVNFYAVQPLSLKDLREVSSILKGDKVSNSLRSLDSSGFHREMISDHASISRAFSTLIEQFQALTTAWEVNQNNYYFVALRVIALCFVAFSFPLRVGKSIHDMRRTKTSKQAQVGVHPDSSFAP
jgi:hypothetical protein